MLLPARTLSSGSEEASPASPAAAVSTPAQQTEGATATVALPRVELRDLRQLKIDPTYQRPKSGEKVRAIKKDFRPESLGVIIISRREEGEEYILDGQHRVQAAIESGYFIHWCQIYEGLDIPQEADIFVGCNTLRFVPSPYYRHNAEKVARRPEAIEVARIALEMGCPITYQHGKGGIAAVTAVKDIYREGGEPLLRQIIGLIQEIWPRDLHMYDGYVFHALYLFLNTYYGTPGFTIDKMVEKLKGQSLSDLLAEANAFARLFGGGTPLNLARAFLKGYNHRLQVNRLPDKLGIGAKTSAARQIDPPTGIEG